MVDITNTGPVSLNVFPMKISTIVEERAINHESQQIQRKLKSNIELEHIISSKL